MHKILTVMILSALATRPSVAQTQPEALVGALDVMCISEPIDFDRLDQRATAMQLKVVADFAPPPRNGASIHSKTWVMGISGRPLALSASRAVGVPHPMQICGIASPDASVEEMRNALMTGLHLGEPMVMTNTEGRHILRWTNVHNATGLVLTTGVFKPNPGFNIILEDDRVQQSR